MILKNIFNKGISLLEVLIVLAIIGIIVLVVFPQFSKMRENQVFQSAVANVLSSLDKARAQTLSSLDSSEYGVRFETNQVIIFKGMSFISGNVNNEIIELASNATISNISLTGSGNTNEIYFNRLSGVPNKTGTITVSTPSFSKIITISASGSFGTN